MKGRDTARAGAPYLLIFLVSAAAMVFQVAQTRLFSASFGYHLAYLVISVSLLGVGFGATLSALFDRRARRPGPPALALALAASAPGAGEERGRRARHHPRSGALGSAGARRRRALHGSRKQLAVRLPDGSLVHRSATRLAADVPRSRRFDPDPRRRRGIE